MRKEPAFYPILDSGGSSSSASAQEALVFNKSIGEEDIVDSPKK